MKDSVNHDLRGPQSRARWLTLPWLATAYLFTGMLLAIPTMLFIVLFPLLPAWAWLLSTVERQRVRMLGRPAIPGPPASLRVPPIRNVPARVASPLGWREIANTLVHLLYAVAGFFLTIFLLTGAVTFLAAPLLPLAGEEFVIGEMRITEWVQALPFALLGLALIAIFIAIATALALTQSAIAVTLTGSTFEELERQVDTLAEQQVLLIDAFDLERQRIERDLHDGPQQHLAGAAMHLGMLRTDLDAAGLPPDSSGYQRLDAAQDEIERALDAIRAAVTGLRPRALIEHGLPAALAELADRSPLPTTVNVDPASRFSPPVEASLYAIATEFIANTLKHSNASRINISLHADAGRTRFVLTDDGSGGANPAGGTGLVGIAQRAKLMHGESRLVSPVGGPTTLTVLIPTKPGERA